jgi:Rrf2 family transcriptional regulator, cysteine metabolism repressor
MKASAKAEYACLTLAELAVRHQRKQPTSLKLLADQYRISHPFLMQIFLQLKGARLVHSTRGSTGGYQLSRPPEDIPLRAIVDAIDGPASETSALDALPDSPLVRVLRRTWREAQHVERDFFDAITLAELVHRAHEIGVVDFQI